MLNKLEKRKVVAQIKKEAKGALDGAIADYRGTNVVAISELRNQARQKQVYIKVARNTLIRRALVDTDFGCFEDRLKGPIILGFSQQELGSVARLFRDFAKEHSNFQVRGLAIKGEFLEPDKIDFLANLPTREEALTQLAGVLQAPVQKLAILLKELPTGLARVLDAVRREKK